MPVSKKLLQTYRRLNAFESSIRETPESVFIKHDILDSYTLRDKLDLLKAKKRANHTKTMQVKIDTPIKVELLAKLKKEGLTFKDLVQASIDVYLGRS